MRSHIPIRMSLYGVLFWAIAVSNAFSVAPPTSSKQHEDKLAEKRARPPAGEENSIQLLLKQINLNSIRIKHRDWETDAEFTRIDSIIEKALQQLKEKFPHAT